MVLIISLNSRFEQQLDEISEKIAVLEEERYNLVSGYTKRLVEIDEEIRKLHREYNKIEYLMSSQV